MQAQSFADVVQGLLPYALTTVLGFVIAILASIVLLVGRKVNPGLAVFGAGLTALGGALGAWWSLPADPSTVADFNQLQLAAVTRFTAWFGMGAVAFFSLLILAVAGARKEPRDLRAALASAAGVTLVVVLTAVAGLMTAGRGTDMVFYARAGCYAVLGALVVAAMLSGGEPDHPGRAAGAAASLTFALTVAVLETSGRAAATEIMLMGLGGVDPANRAETVTNFMALTNGQLPWLLATIGVAMLVGVLGVANAAREKQYQAWAGLIWLIVVPPIVWFGGTPSVDQVIAAAATLP